MTTKNDNTTTAPATRGWLARLVRKFTEWAWAREYYANGDVFILFFEKTERTYGGDLKTRFILSVWSTRAEAERAEALAWNDDMHQNWTKETVATWIEHQPVQCFANGKSDERQPSSND